MQTYTILFCLHVFAIAFAYKIIPINVSLNGSDFAPQSIHAQSGSILRFFFHSNRSLFHSELNPCLHPILGRRLYEGRTNLTFDYYVGNEYPHWFYTSKRCNSRGIFQLNVDINITASGNQHIHSSNRTVNITTVTVTATDTTTISSTEASAVTGVVTGPASLIWPVTYWNSSSTQYLNVASPSTGFMSIKPTPQSNVTSNSGLLLQEPALEILSLFWGVLYLLV
jgi:hypothetical protein